MSTHSENSSAAENVGTPEGWNLELEIECGKFN